MSLLAAIPPPPFSGLELGPLDVRLYGVVIAVGAFLALRLVVARYAGSGGDADLAEKTALLGLAGGFLGARIGYIIPRFLVEGAHGAPYYQRPLDILAIWQGGLAFFGGLVGGALVVVLYLRLRDGDLPAMADAIAPALPLAQAFGRWGNYFNQELFGRPTDLPWALRVESGPATRAGYPDATTFHPTFLYESVWNLALVGVILLIDRRGWLRHRGSLIFVYLIGYGIGRGWVELLRVDTDWRLLGLSRNNWIALLVILVGVVGLIWWERRGRAVDATDADPDTDRTDPPDTDASPPDAHTDPATTSTGQADDEVTPADPDAESRSSGADPGPDRD